LSAGGGKQIESPDQFQNLITVLNGTLAWDVGGNFDPTRCIDFDPCVIYENGEDVGEPLKDIVV